MKPRVVFMGSGPVAAKSLELLAGDFDVEAVITKPRAEHHKGDVPVLSVAEKLGLPTHTLANQAELTEFMKTVRFESQVAILVDYGIIVEQSVIDYFPKGIINSHFSLLPEWRGADPITFSILSGQKRTGVSIMLLVAGLDEGPLLSQAPFDIPDGMTTPELTDVLIQISHQSLCHVVSLYLAGQARPADQLKVTLADSKTPTYSRKLTKEDSVLDFTKPAQVLEREIRAFIGWPGSKTILAGKDVTITAAHVVSGSGGAPGTPWLGGEAKAKQLGIYTSQDIFAIDRLKPAGKGEMTAQAFLAGYGQLLKSE